MFVMMVESLAQRFNREAHNMHCLACLTFRGKLESQPSVSQPHLSHSQLARGRAGKKKCQNKGISNLFRNYCFSATALHSVILFGIIECLASFYAYAELMSCRWRRERDAIRIRRAMGRQSHLFCLVLYAVAWRGYYGVIYSNSSVPKIFL